MKKNVYVVKGVSEKSKKEYVKLYIDFGYNELPISFNGFTYYFAKLKFVHRL